jgi:hypothetical protein
MIAGDLLVRNDGSVRARLSRLTQTLPGAMEAIAESILLLGEREVKGEIAAADLLFRRVLLNGWLTQIETHGTNARREVLGRLWSEEVHAPVMEYGRRPGRRPPIDAIAQWVSERITLTGITGPRRKDTESVIRALAYVMARRIGERGIMGRGYFRRAVSTMRGAAGEIARRIIAQWRAG